MSYLLVIANKTYSSWSMRLWVIMTHLDIPFEEKVLPSQNTGDVRQAEYLRYSPPGKLPCLHHLPSPDTNNNNEDGSNSKISKAIIVWDSLAIVEYLAELEPTRLFWPPTTDREARAFARSAAAEMHASFLTIRDEISCHMALRIHLSHEAASTSLLADLRRLDELWVEGLRRFGGPWIAGTQFCTADAFFAPMATRLRTFGIMDWVSAPAREYAGRLLEVPAVKRWVAEALQEQFRNEWKEQDCIRGRKVLADLREISKE